MTNPWTQTRFAALGIGTLLALALNGCGTGIAPTQTASIAPTGQSSYTGRVMGGQQPIAGSTIQLYAVNTTTLRGASTPLIAATVLTDSGGNFSITGDYTCPTNALVYLTATGGNSGGGSNADISEIAALGACSALSSSTFILLNEVVTVASTYALAPFMADYAHIGAPATSLNGITNAFANVNNLVSIAYGSSPGAAAPTNAAIPSTELNTLANIIAACINGASTCSTLFSNALPLSGSPTPSDTVSALLNIARNPGANVSTLFGLQVAQAPFQPSLTSAPADFTVSIKLTGNSLSSPYGLAIDGSGNAWVTNETGASISEFSPTGTALAGSGNAYAFKG